MDRIELLKGHVDAILATIGDPTERWCAYAHLYGVSQMCAVIAAKRDLDVEMATMAGLLHDIYEYAYYDRLEPLAHRPDHGIRNGQLARQMLGQIGVTNELETYMICEAINNHGYKDQVHAPLDEVVKDADVLQKQTQNVHLPIHPVHEKRFFGLMREFGLNWHGRVGVWK